MKKITLLILSCYIANFGWSLESSPPINLSQKGAVVASRASMNTQGTAAVVWVKTLGQNAYCLEASNRAAGNPAWATAQSVSDPMDVLTFLPNITIDGTCTILWSCLTPQKTVQHYCCKKESTTPTWPPAQAIDYPGLPIIRDVIVDFKGDPLVLASYPGEIPIYSYHHKANEIVTKPFRDLPKLPRSDEVEAIAPVMLTNQLGKIIALWGNRIDAGGWVRTLSKDYHFIVSSYEDSAQWGMTRTDIGTLNFKNLDKDKVKDISASFNKQQDIAVIWSHFDSESAKHQLKSLINRKTEVIKDSQEGFTDTSILMDDNGNVVAVWIQPLKKQNVVYAAFKPKDKETWQGEPQQLSNINNQAEQAQLSFHNGFFVVVWGETDTTKKSSIFGTTLAPKSEKFEWSPATQLSPAGQNCWRPSMAFSEKEGIITWTTHVKKSTDYQIQVADLKVP